jgi:hypothetical protein
LTTARPGTKELRKFGDQGSETAFPSPAHVYDKNVNIFPQGSMKAYQEKFKKGAIEAVAVATTRIVYSGDCYAFRI